MISQELINQLQEELDNSKSEPVGVKYPTEEKKLSRYLSDYKDLFKISNAIIAGGSITSLFTNTEINDIDVYFRNKEDLSRFLCGAFSKECGWLQLMHMTDRSVLLSDHSGLKIQLIVYKFFDSPKEVFDAFDFSVNMGAYDFKVGGFVLDERFLRHNSQRYIEINTKTDYPLISVLRVDKYREKGYRISKPQLLALLMSVSDLKMENWLDVVDQISGMYGVDPAKLFDQTKEFSLDEVIVQLQALETVDGVFIPNNPNLKDLAEKLGGKLTEEAKQAMIDFNWSTDIFLDIAFDEDIEEVRSVAPVKSPCYTTTRSV